MSKSSYAEVIQDWERLLLAVKEDGKDADLAAVEPFRAELAGHLEATKLEKARQDTTRASRQQSTQVLTEMLEQGKELAKRLRSLLKGHLGTKNEKLVQYRIAIRRKSGRRSDKPGEEVPETPPASAARPKPENS